VSKLKRLLCYESQHQSLSNEKSLVQFDYEKAVSNYLGTQSTFNPIYMYYYKSRRGEHLCARAIQISTETEVAKLSTTAIHFTVYLQCSCERPEGVGLLECGFPSETTGKRAGNWRYIYRVDFCMFGFCFQLMLGSVLCTVKAKAFVQHIYIYIYIHLYI